MVLPMPISSARMPPRQGCGFGGGSRCTLRVYLFTKHTAGAKKPCGSRWLARKRGSHIGLLIAGRRELTSPPMRSAPSRIEYDISPEPPARATLAPASTSPPATSKMTVSSGLTSRSCIQCSACRWYRFMLRPTSCGGCATHGALCLAVAV